MGDSRSIDKQMTYAEKKRRALELRRDCWGYQDIADEIGWRSHSSAHKAVTQALKETLQEPADELRILEAERLNDLYKFTMSRISNDNLWAVDRALKIMERRASLLGLDHRGDEDNQGGSDFLRGADAARKLYYEKQRSGTPNGTPNGTPSGGG